MIHHICPFPVPPIIHAIIEQHLYTAHSGGWGYSASSVEAIRFSSDTDVVIGGFGLYGGRGTYNAEIKVFYMKFVFCLFFGVCMCVCKGRIVACWEWML